MSLRRRVLIASLLLVLFAIAVYIRVQPAVRYGAFLTEFDPYMRYYIALKFEQHGGPLGGLAWWLSWWWEPVKELDKKFWYPYGVDIRKIFLPGVSLTGDVVYRVARALGINVTLLEACVYTPAIVSSFIVFAAYLLGRAVKDEYVGLAAAAYAAVVPAFVMRSTAGWFDDESVSVPLIVLGLALYIMSLGADKLYKRILYAALAGLSLGFVAWTWGAYIYVWNLLALHFLISLLFGVYKDVKEFGATHLVTSAVIAAFVATIPRYGPKALTSPTSALPIIAIVVALATMMLPRRVHAYVRARIKIFVIVALVIGLAAFGAGVALGKISGRLLGILLPYMRSPIVESVGEHRVSSWYMMYGDLSLALPLSIAALLYILFAERLDERKFLLIVYFLTALYAAAAMVRLVHLLVPAVTVLPAYLLISLTERANEAGAKLVSVRRGRKFARYMKVSPRIYHGVTATFLLLLVISYGVCFQKAMVYAQQPQTILTSTLGYVPSGEYNLGYADWLAAIEWMRENLPPDAVVAAWWDYGYWISIYANRTSLADNSTVNGTQIALIAKAFMSDEETAIKIFRRLGVKYVVVFEPALPIYSGVFSVYIPHPRGAGDFGKSYWMLRIAGIAKTDEETRKYIAHAVLSTRGYTLTIIVPANTTEAQQATLYKLIFGAQTDRMWVFDPSIAGSLSMFGMRYTGPTVRIDPPKYFKLIYRSRPNGWVLVFEVIYPEESGE